MKKKSRPCKECGTLTVCSADIPVCFDCQMSDDSDLPTDGTVSFFMDLPDEETAESVADRLPNATLASFADRGHDSDGNR